MLAVAWLTLQHAYWRDEVRGLSMALQGDGFVDMWHHVKGDGHPALWHLLLRGAHELVPTPRVLPAVSLFIAAATVALLALRSPFGWPMLIVLLLGRPLLYEYSVMARNYGISMLLMFAFAALYPRHRERGLVLGAVLFLLTNTNVHSVVLAGAFGLFWLLDLLWGTPARQPKALRNFWINSAIAALGVVLCVLTVYPTFNDAAVPAPTGESAAVILAKALVLPGKDFLLLSGFEFWRGVLRPLHPWPFARELCASILASALLVCSTLVLVRRPAALLAALAALGGLSVVFAVVYPGAYRHQALWLMFLTSLYWITSLDTRGAREGRLVERLRRLGLLAFSALLVVQAAHGIRYVTPILFGTPESRSRDVAQWIAAQPELRQAVVIADPDYLVEPLSYYIPNRTYLIREARFGNIVHFTHRARLDLSIADILDEARMLATTTKQPVVILLSFGLDPEAGAATIKESYNWRLSSTPEQVSSFLSATRRIARFGPTCCTDEQFDAYVLDP